MHKFSQVCQLTFSKLQPKHQKECEEILEKERQAIVSVDVNGVLWRYRQFLLQVEKVTMEDKGFIPFDSTGKTENYDILIDYLNRCEEVSFALL